MAQDDAKPPTEPGLEETAAPTLDTPALDQTLAAGTQENAAGVVKGSVIRPPPKPLTETVSGDSDAGIVIPEERVDRYLLKRRIGAGGMGVVYQATDSELGRDVAIKMIKSGASAERLKREAQALARLDHRNVVTVHDVGVHDGRVWVAMELVDGANLHGWCDADHSTDEIMGVLFQAADGIMAAHAAGLIHRDLKPDNIFVSKDGTVLVGDFGLARDVDDDDGQGFDTASPAMSLTQTGHVLGTPAYMAPEQAEGMADERSDQFSFCVTAYEALYGTRPYVGTTFQEILDRVDSGEIEAPKRRRRVPASIAAAIRRGLSADPAKRFGSMRELVEALKPKPRRVWPWLVGGGVLAVGATIGVVLAMRGDRAAVCSATGGVETVWNPASRTQLMAKLRERAFTPKAVDEITTRLDEYATRWSTQVRETCLAKSNGELDVRAATARSVCHSLALGAFESAVHTFETDVATTAMIAVKHAASLPAVESCASEDSLKLAVASAEHQALMLELTSWRTVDLAKLAALRARAEAANDLPAQLEIAIAEANRALLTYAYPAGEAALQRGMPIAEQLDAGGARTRLLALAAQSRCAQNKDPESYLKMAEAAAKRLDPVRNALELTSVLEARVECLIRSPDPAPAIPILEQLIASTKDRNATQFDEMPLRSNLALVYRRLGRSDDAAKQEAMVVAIMAQYAGDTSYLAHEAANAASAAMMAGDLHAAIAHQLRAIPLFTQKIHQAQALVSLAMYYDVVIDWRSAIAAQAEAIKLFSALPVTDFIEEYLAEAHIYSGWDRLYLDDNDGALSELERGLPLATKFDKAELIAVAQLGLGRVWLARKEYARAIRFSQEGLATHTKLGDAAQFRVAVGLFTLAQAQWAVEDRFSARQSIAKAEIAGTKGLEQARAHSMGSYGMPYKQRKVDEIVRWRDAHR